MQRCGVVTSGLAATLQLVACTQQLPVIGFLDRSSPYATCDMVQFSPEWGGSVMKATIRAICVALACALPPIATAAAQPATSGCSSESSSSTTFTIRCKGGVTIVVEDHARYTLRDRDGNGRVDSVELGDRALLLEVPRGRNEFKVFTPQAIAAVRGTRWAVDVAENKTSVFVVNGRVAVGRPVSRQSVTLGPGEGVDVEPAGPLTVKRWPPARVAALMARLGQ
jgi:ferric-dicitrate binding protein FerR (iron transport regulator)